MCLFKNRHRDNNAAVDENQAEYRKEFGIVDKYLLKYHIDNNKPNQNYIIFIDYDYDIDWIDERDKSSWSINDVNEFNNRLAYLDLIQSRPVFNLEDEEKLAYKILLGNAYIQAFHNNFGVIDRIVDEADQYYKKRNSENARKYCLNYSGVMTFFVILVLFLLHSFSTLDSECFKWTLSIGMGIVGSYVSIWGRYSRYVLEGVSSKKLYILESISRLFIGGIFSFVAMLCIKSGISFSFITSEIEIYACPICGFLCGFSENFIPSLIEKIAIRENS